MAGVRSRHPPKVEWDARKNDIRHWYLGENKTCRDIQSLLKEQQFFVSERQIKNRLNEWNFERKKTPAHHYLAMSTVADHHAAQGLEIVFNVPKREERVEYNVPKVKKECERVKKRYARDGVSLNIPSMDEAQRVLQDAHINWQPRQSVAFKSPIECIAAGETGPWNERFSDQASPDENSSTGDDGDLCVYAEPALPPPKDWNGINGLNTINLVSESSLSHAPITMSSQPTPAHEIPQVNTPETSSSSASPISPASYRGSPCLAIHFPSSSDMVNPSSCHSPELHLGPAETISTPSLELCAFQQFEFSNPTISDHFSGGRSTTGRSSTMTTTSRSLYCRKCSAQNDQQDYDFTEAIGNLSMGSAKVEHEQADIARSLTDISAYQRPSMDDDHKSDASRWAAPYYTQCFATHTDEEAIKHSKSLSMEALQTALKQDNQYILPCLSWTMLVLGSNLRMEQLVDFLRSSCDIIRQQPKMRESFTYELPFRYALAWASNDLVRMDEHGKSLPISLHLTRLLWGRLHPNYLVTAHFYAWDLIRRRDYQQAILLLEECLPISARVMGQHDLLTVTCLVIASRAYTEIGNVRVAAAYLQKALDAIEAREKAWTGDVNGFHHRVWEQYQATLHFRLAQLKLYQNDHSAAEQGFWHVLQTRTYFCGLEDSATWSAVCTLCEIFDKSGRERLSNYLKEYMHKWLHWDNNRAWFEERGKKPPPEPKLW